MLLDTTVAPSLQAAAEQVKKEKIASNLEHKLENRPEATALEQKNILKGMLLASRQEVLESWLTLYRHVSGTFIAGCS